MILVTQGGREARRSATTKEFKRRLAFTAQQAADGARCCRRRPRPRSPTTRCTRSMTTRSSRWAAQEEVHARHILVETEDEAKAVLDRAQEGHRFRRARQGKVEGSGRRRWRRSRLFRQGPDGAGIRRGRVQDVQGPGLRSGEDAVRLAHHQGRGQAHQAAAGIRQGQGPDRDLRGAQGADRFHRQAAPDRQDRAARQAGRAEASRAE